MVTFKGVSIMKAIDDICNKLLDEIEEGCSKASVYRKQIEKLQVSKNVAEESLDLEIRPEPSILISLYINITYKTSYVNYTAKQISLFGVQTDGSSLII